MAAIDRTRARLSLRPPLSLSSSRSSPAENVFSSPLAEGARRWRTPDRPSSLLISQALGVPYRDKGTTMTGFKDWLTQISGAICHAPTGRRSVASPASPPPPLPPSSSCHPLLPRFTPSSDASSVPYRPRGPVLSSVPLPFLLPPPR
jgi:hypothetical protein